jgi:hypothetical protein
MFWTCSVCAEQSNEHENGLDSISPRTLAGMFCWNDEMVKVQNSNQLFRLHVTGTRKDLSTYLDPGPEGRSLVFAFPIVPKLTATSGMIPTNRVAASSLLRSSTHVHSIPRTSLTAGVGSSTNYARSLQTTSPAVGTMACQPRMLVQPVVSRRRFTTTVQSMW